MNWQLKSTLLTSQQLLHPHTENLIDILKGHMEWQAIQKTTIMISMQEKHLGHYHLVTTYEYR